MYSPWDIQPRRSKSTRKAARRSKTFYHSITLLVLLRSSAPSSFLFVYRYASLFCISTSSRKFFCPWLSFLDFSRVGIYLPCCLEFTHTSIRIEETSEAAMILASAPNYPHSLPVQPVRSLSAVSPLSRRSSSFPSGGSATTLPAYVYAPLVMAIATRRAIFSWTHPRLLGTIGPKGSVRLAQHQNEHCCTLGGRPTLRRYFLGGDSDQATSARFDLL